MSLNEPDSRYTDIRAIHMERERKHRFTSSEVSWMTLGHFNWTHVDNLSDKLSNNTEVDLDGIRRQNLAIINQKTKRKSYCQPIYILREFDYTQKRNVNAFWDRPAAFMVITRIHSSLLNQLDFEKSVDEHLEDSNPIDTREALSKTVIYLRYRTLDLSDVVLVMKSDSVYSLMYALGRLYSTPTIGDIYSYYCIRQEELMDNQDSSLAVTTDSRILASIRFAVHDASLMESFLRELKDLPQFTESAEQKCVFFVTGTEDINAIATNLSSAGLCRIFAFFLYTLDEQKPYYNAVDDITTRIGIPEGDLIIDQESRTNRSDANDLTVVYSGLRLQLISALANEVQKDWHRTIIETVDSLIEMSTDSVLRPVCFILLGAVNGVVNKISNKLIDSAEMEQELNEFLIGITYVMEHILRMEGELVHHPETRPLLFDIPASILEFDLALVDRCARYFKTREYKCQDFKLLEEADNREYDFLLVPRLYTDITIHDFCNKRDDDLRLLYVEIPLSLMYNPFEVSCSLVHEAAHHCGEITRHRRLRQNRLCFCCATLLAEELGIDDSINTVTYIHRRLALLLKEELHKQKLVNRVYLRELLPIFYDLVQRIVCDKDVCLEFIRAYIVDKPTYSTIPSKLFDEVYLNYMESERDVSAILEIQQQIYQVSSLFSECYADLAMKNLLSLSDCEYLRLFKKDYNLYSCPQSDNSSEKMDKATYVLLLERVALVLCAVSDNVLLSLQEISEKNVDLVGLTHDLEVFCKEFIKQGERTTVNLPYNSDTDTPIMPYHAFSILDAILGYLQQCLKTIEQLDIIQDNAEEKRKIIDSFETFAKRKRLASDEFLDEIGQYRTRIIQSIPVK